MKRSVVRICSQYGKNRFGSHSNNMGTASGISNTLSYDFLTGLKTKISVFCDLTPCSLTDVYQRFGET
jgi:hypothetical protein